MPLADDPLLTFKEVARRLNVSRWTVYRLRDDGLLPVVPVGRGRVRESALDRYIRDSEGTRARRASARRA